MPMQKQLYPPNWEEIALQLKEAADWTCQRCGARPRPAAVRQYDSGAAGV